MTFADSFDTASARMEKFLSWKDHLPSFSSRNIVLDPKNNVCAITQDISGHKQWNWASNIVTNDGDIFYAIKGAANGTLPANMSFHTGKCELRTGAATPAKADTYVSVTTPITASRDTLEAGYSKTADDAADNSGAAADAVSYKYYWATSDFAANGIAGGCIHDNATPIAATKLLTHWSFADTFSKTSTDTLTLYVNHTMNGI